MAAVAYIAYCWPLCLVKIGHSANLNKRIRHLPQECGYRANVVATFPGGRYKERQLHKRFSAHAVGHEWFRPEGKLARFLEGYGWKNDGRSASELELAHLEARYANRAKYMSECHRRCMRQRGQIQKAVTAAMSK